MHCVFVLLCRCFRCLKGRVTSCCAWCCVCSWGCCCVSSTVACLPVILPPQTRSVLYPRAIATAAQRGIYTRGGNTIGCAYVLLTMNVLWSPYKGTLELELSHPRDTTHSPHQDTVFKSCPNRTDTCVPLRRFWEYEDMSLKRGMSYPLLHSGSFQLPTTEGKFTYDCVVCSVLPCDFFVADEYKYNLTLGLDLCHLC